MSIFYIDSASFGNVQISGSLQGTASYASTASYVSPLSQNVEITGSLFVSNSINSENRQLIDSNGSGSIDWQDRGAPDANGVRSLNWGSRYLHRSDNIVIVDWENGLFTGSLSGTASFATTASYINKLNQDVIITGSVYVSGSLLPTDRVLYDSGSGRSIDWQNRRLKDNGGKDVVDWGNGKLNDTSIKTSIDWVNRIAYGSTTSASIDWDARQLSDESSNKSISWQNRRLLKSDGNTISLNWETGALTGSLLGTASYATTANTASYVTTAQTASYAETASYLQNPIYIDNEITVGLPGSVVDYNSIQDAVNSIVDATQYNPYTVIVGPGVYIEDTITVPSWVNVKGDSSISTIVSASNPDNGVFVLGDQSMLIDMQIQGSTGTGAAAVLYSSPTTPQKNAIAYVENVRFGSNYTNAKVIGTSGGNCILQCSNVKYGGFTSTTPKTFDIGFYATNDGSGIGRMQLRNVTSTNGGITGSSDQVFALAYQPGCTFIVNGCLLT